MGKIGSINNKDQKRKVHEHDLTKRGKSLARRPKKNKEPNISPKMEKKERGRGDGESPERPLEV